MGFRTTLWRLTWPLRAMGQKGLAVGTCFPDFSLRDLEGGFHSLSDNPSGKLTVLWFTNLCEDCRAKIPLLEALRKEARWRVLAVSILGGDETLPRQAAASCGLTFLLDPDDVVGRRLGLTHPPGTCPLHNLFIVAPSGRILFRRHLSAMAPEVFSATCRRLAAQTHPG